MIIGVTVDRGSEKGGRVWFGWQVVVRTIVIVENHPRVGVRSGNSGILCL